MIRTLRIVGLSLLMSGFSSVVLANHVNEECREGDKISCVDLAIQLSLVDSTLDSQMVQFDSLGALLAAVKGSAVIFGQVNTILTSGPHAVAAFATVDALYDAVNKCGLIPHVIDEIND